MGKPTNRGEQQRGLALAEHKYYINQQPVNANTPAMVFVSHVNSYTKPIKYRIHLYNPGSTDIIVTRTNIGFAISSNNTYDANKMVESYYVTQNTQITVPATGSRSKWLTDAYTVNTNQTINGMVGFKSTGKVSVTCYAFENESSVIGTEVAYPYSKIYSDDITVYSGIGEKFSLNVNHPTLDVSKLSRTTPYRYITNSPTITDNSSNEITPIKLVGTANYIAELGKAEPYHNVGNWSTIYKHKMKLQNTSTSNKIKVYGYIGANPNENTHCVAYGSKIKGTPLQGKTWRWCEIELLAGEETTVEWETILAGGTASTAHAWSICDPGSDWK